MTILVACEKCGFRYKLKDELAGKKVKCKECQAVATAGHGDSVGGGG